MGEGYRRRGRWLWGGWTSSSWSAYPMGSGDARLGLVVLYVNVK